MKKILSVTLIICFILSLCSAFSVAGTEILTVTSVKQVSDTQILVQFSEPVAINKNGDNRGPYAALRLVTEGDSLVWEGSTPMQFAGPIYFADSVHDKIVFVYSEDDVDVTALLNLDGPLAAYKGLPGYSVKLCFEEVPFTDGAADGYLDNITTLDGRTLLTATKPVYWEGCYFAPEKDFSVELDSDDFEACRDPDKNLDYGRVFTAEKAEPLGNAKVTDTVAADIARAKKWLDEKIENNELMSFSYGNLRYNEFIGSWKKTVKTSADEEGNTLYTLTYSNGGVSCTCEVKLYRDFPAIDWVGGFANSGKDPSDRISSIYILGSTVEMKNPTLGYARGSTAEDSDFEYLTFDFKSKNATGISCSGGRSSSGYMPYFDLTDSEGGIIGAIGWTGQWSAYFTKKNDGKLEILCGMTRTSVKLKAGEEMRTPSMVLLFFSGDCDYGHNLWRRLVLREYTPEDENGETVTTLPHFINYWGGITEGEILSGIKQNLNYGTDFDACWIDAGWYGDKTSDNAFLNIWYGEAGSWYPNPNLFPDGFKTISDLLHENGKKFLLWFEPERVARGTQLWNEHPEWIITRSATDDNGLWDLADDEAALWLTDYVDSMIKDYGVDWYRQDFNIEPLAYWSARDKTEGSSRTGISEIKYITNLYKFLDTLVEKNPGLLIDNCASGGRRLDIEMTKRSFPLWRSDYYCGGEGVTTYSEACYTISANLAYWLPLSCGGQATNGVTDTYDYRATSGAGVIRGNSVDYFTWWDELIEEFYDMGEYLTMDYYKLTDFSAKKEDYLTSLAAYEYCSYDKKKGAITAFRPEECEETDLTVYLKGLDPNSDYTFICSDNGETVTLDGTSAMNGGLTLHLNSVRESLLIYFVKEDTSSHGWKLDKNGWYFENEDGSLKKNQWYQGKNGWRHFNSAGYLDFNKWVKDSKGWCYCGEDGYTVSNKWIKDSKGWCYCGADGYMVYNKWVRDSKGWCHVGTSGYMEYNKWIKDSKGWCYVDGSGYMVYNKWVKDSKGWCHVGTSGYMEYNKWIKDSKGWCYVDGSGYMVYSKWVKDSKGWCYVGADGYQVYNTKVGKYTIGKDGYMK